MLLIWGLAGGGVGGVAGSAGNNYFQFEYIGVMPERLV